MQLKSEINVNCTRLRSFFIGLLLRRYVGGEIHLLEVTRNNYCMVSTAHRILFSNVNSNTGRPVCVVC